MVKYPPQVIQLVQKNDIAASMVFRRFMAVFFAAMLCTSVLTTGGVALQSSPNTELAFETTNETVDDGDTRPVSAYEQRQKAIDEIRSINSTLSQEERESLETDVHESLSVYLDENRVRNDSVYSNDRRVLSEMEGVVSNIDDTGSTNDDTSQLVAELQLINNSSSRVVKADTRSAASSINDAERAIAIAENESLDPVAISTARSELETAKTLYSSATDSRTDAGLCCDVNGSIDEQTGALREALLEREASVQELQNSYGYSQQAIQTLAEAGLSRLHIRTREDPIDTENETRYFQGTVLVVEPDEVENVRVVVNDKESFSVPVEQPEEPLRNASFVFPVNLTQGVNTIEVTANRTIGENETGERDLPVAYDVLRLDGDGLPDWYEQDVTQTDPGDPDSDSSATLDDEGGDGIEDAAEDFDNDTLPTIREARLETDPVSADTDGDGLADPFELYVAETDPLNPDTDGNGILDGADDIDGDGLTNSQEANLETDPRLADSDSDDLNDPNELQHDTDPVNPDTDDDYLRDGAEVSAPFNTNPNDSDTDGDGILDGNETYTTSKSNVSQGVEVDLTGEGDVADGTTITNGERELFKNSGLNSTRATEFVRFKSTREFESAEITFAYNEDEIEGDEADLSVFRFNETMGTFEPVASTVDPVSDTVTAETGHFSTYVVLNRALWKSIVSQVNAINYNTTYTEGETDVTFIADTSGSMGGKKADLRDASAKHYIGNLNGSDKGGLVDFGSTATTTQHLTTDHNSLESSVDNLDASGGTDIAGGIDEAIAEFDRNSNDSRDQVGILITDGKSDSQSARDAAHRAADAGIMIHTIGMGSTDNQTLDDVASITGGTFSYISDTSQLPTLFVNHTNDTDNDGIPDKLEEGGMRVSLGSLVTTNPNNPDTDGDGLADGEEIIVEEMVETQFGPIYYMRSNPNRVDTDRDGLDDQIELSGWDVNVIDDGGERPYRYDYNDQTNDTERFSSNPLWEDSDLDGVDDKAEKELLRTDPKADITYGITAEHQQEVIDAALEEWRNGNRYYLTRTLRNTGLLADDESPEDLEDRTLDDGSDSFDFIYNDSNDSRLHLEETVTNRFIYSSHTRKDHNEFESETDIWQMRTDTWYSNEHEVYHPDGASDPWDPDSDDDGLTDGQESRWITEVDLPGGLIQVGYSPRIPIVKVDSGATRVTSPIDPDSDGDGYWDGWIGVRDVGYSDNVVLYMENLQTGDGIEGDEIVSEQTGIYEVTDSTTSGVDIYGNGSSYHSNLHLGERYWGTNPTASGSYPTDQLQLEVEVDYVRNTSWPGNGSPFSVTNDDDVRLTDAVERNYALYDIDVRMVEDDEITKSELRDVEASGVVANGYNRGTKVTPEGLNRFELGAIEDAYHDDPSTLHMLWSTPLANDEPKTLVDDNSDYSKAGGLAWHVGAPESPAVKHIESDFGVMIARDKYSPDEYQRLQSVTMHELGHALSVGWADDTAIPTIGSLIGEKAFEVYSGNSLARLAGGEDRTPETVSFTQEWSIMMAGTADDFGESEPKTPILVFSIEEAGTMDFEHIPSKDQD